MAVVMLALPGVVFYNVGTGLPDVDLPDEVLQGSDIKNSGRTGHAVAMAAGCRFPGRGRIPHSGSRRVRSTQFCRYRPEWAALTTEKQRADAGSTLSFSTHSLSLRLRQGTK